MNIKSSFKLLVAVISLASFGVFGRSTDAQTAYMTDRVNFYCGEFTDDTGETMPATMAYVPQRKASVSIIGWKSNHIPSWDAQRRCDTASPKFQAFYEDGRLNYLTTGVNNGQDIICAAVETGQPCKPEDQLFQVKASDDPDAVLKGLTGIIEGAATSGEPIYQSSDEKIYVSMDKFLEAAPVVEASE